MSPFQQQLEFVKACKNIPALRPRICDLVTNSGYQGFAIPILEIESEYLLKYFRNNNLDVQCVKVKEVGGFHIHLIQGISKSEIAFIRKDEL